MTSMRRGTGRSTLEKPAGISVAIIVSLRLHALRRSARVCAPILGYLASCRDFKLAVMQCHAPLCSNLRIGYGGRCDAEQNAGSCGMRRR